MSTIATRDPLPEALPVGEVVLWQGAPVWTGLARGAFRVWHVAAYFGVLGLWRAVALVVDGAPLGSAITTALWFVPLGLACVSILLLLAWLSARATTYTLTSRRLILQVGVALPITMNLPLQKIGSAAVRPYADGSGDLPLTLVRGERMPYWALWPHARPWHFSHPEPMLRAIPQAAVVAEILAKALAATGPSTRGTGVPSAADTAWPGAPEHAHQRPSR